MGMEKDKATSALQRCMEHASGLQVDAADGLACFSVSKSVRIRKGETESVEQESTEGLGLRVMVNGSQASASTMDLEDSSLDDFVSRLVSLARATARDPDLSLPDREIGQGEASWPDESDRAAQGVNVDELRDLALEAEAAGFEVDPRIDNSEGAEASVGAYGIAYADTEGLSRWRSSTSFSLVCTMIARDAASGEMERDYWWASRRFRDDLPTPAEIGKAAGLRAIRRLGAGNVASAAMPVVLAPQPAAGLLRHLSSAMNGYSIYRGASFLCGKMGDKVAASSITLVDDPHISGAVGSRGFDGEGANTCKNVLIEDGVLGRYILDTYSAKKLGMVSGRQAVRSLGGPPRAGTSNLHLLPGNTPPEEIIAQVSQGVYISEFIGMGVNMVTGDFSKGATGFLIENGKLGPPIREFTVAGNLHQLMQDISVVGSDLDPYRGVSSPTLLVKSLSIGGSG